MKVHKFTLYFVKWNEIMKSNVSESGNENSRYYQLHPQIGAPISIFFEIGW